MSLCSIRVDKVSDGIYLSDVIAVLTSEGRRTLQALQIKRILTASFEIHERRRLPNVEYKLIEMIDHWEQDVIGTGHLQAAIDYMEEASMCGEPILVHCEAGRSRSVTFICAYLMKKHEWTVEQALAHVRGVRPIAEPNASFMLQLKIFEVAGYVADPVFLSKCDAYKTFIPGLKRFGIKPLRDVGVNAMTKDDYLGASIAEKMKTLGIEPLEDAKMVTSTEDSNRETPRVEKKSLEVKPPPQKKEIIEEKHNISGTPGGKRKKKKALRLGKCALL